MKTGKIFMSMLFVILALSGCSSGPTPKSVVAKIQKGETLTKADYDVIYDYVIDFVDDIFDGARNNDQGQIMDVFNKEMEQGKLKEFEKVLPPNIYDEVLKLRMFGLDVPRSSFYPANMSYSDDESESVGATCDTEYAFEEEILEEVADTGLAGRYAFYTGDIAQSLEKLGATEISQEDRDYLFLPARIARVSRGKHERSMNKVRQILSDDIIGYFNIGNMYDTPLKRKHFNTDESSKWFIDEFALVKKELSKQKFYVSFPISGNYDLETGTFTIKIPHSDFLNINNNELDQEISISTSSDYIWGMVVSL